MNDLVWDKRMLGAFIALAYLTEEEEIVLREWANGKSIAYTTVHHNMCDTKVKDIRKTLREKYDAVQIYTPLLPKRIQ
jgi:hypothetical protein